MLDAVRRRARGARFATVLGAIWGLWVPLFAVDPMRSFIESHIWLLWAQGPLVATITLLIGDWGRSRSVESPPTAPE